MERSHSPIHVLVQRILAIFLTQNVLSVLSLATLPSQTIRPRHCSLALVFDVRNPGSLPGCLDKLLTNMAATPDLCLSRSSSKVNKTAHERETIDILGSFEVSYILYSCADFWVANNQNIFRSMKSLRKVYIPGYSGNMDSLRVCHCLNQTLLELLCSSNQQLGTYTNSNIKACPTRPWLFNRSCYNVWNLEDRMYSRHKIKRRFLHTPVNLAVNDTQNMNLIHLTSNFTALRLSIKTKVHCLVTKFHGVVGSMKSSPSGTSSEVAHEIKYHYNNRSPRRKRTASCPVGSYGPACAHSCHCRNQASCQRTSGLCWPYKCATEWKGDNCSVRVCPEGNYSNGGVKCSNKCQCPVGMSCHGVTGECEMSECTNLPANSCELQVCPRKFFGYTDCRGVCHCQTDETCHPRTGQCHFSLCLYGFHQPSCQEMDPQLMRGKGFYTRMQVLLILFNFVFILLFRVIPLIRHICNR